MKLAWNVFSDTLHSLRIIAKLQNSHSLFYVLHLVYCWSLSLGDAINIMPFSSLFHGGLTVKVLPVLYGKDTHFLLDLPAILCLLPAESPGGSGFAQIATIFPFAPAQPLGRSISIPILYWRLLKCLH